MDVVTWVKLQQLIAKVDSLESLLIEIFYKTQLTGNVLQTVLRREHPLLLSMYGWDVSDLTNNHIQNARAAVTAQMLKLIGAPAISSTASLDNPELAQILGDLADNSWIRTSDSANLTITADEIGSVTPTDDIWRMQFHNGIKVPSVVGTLVVEGTPRAVPTLAEISQSGIGRQLWTNGRAEIRMTLKTDIVSTLSGKITWQPATLVLRATLEGEAEVLAGIGIVDDIREALGGKIPTRTGSVVTFELTDVIPVSNTLDSVKTFGLLLVWKSVSYVNSGPAPSGPNEYDRLRYDYIYSWGIDSAGPVILNWTGFKPPIGISAPAVNINSDLDRIAVRVAELSTVLASQIASIESGNVQMTPAEIFQQLGSTLSMYGMAASLLSGPIGGAMMAVGAAMIGAGEIIDAVSTGNATEGVEGLIMSAIGVASTIHGLLGTVMNDLPENVVKGAAKMVAQTPEVVLKAAEASIAYDVAPEVVLSKTEYYVRPLKGDITSQVPSEYFPALLNKSKIGKALVGAFQNKIASGAEIAYFPKYGETVSNGLYDEFNVHGQYVRSTLAPPTLSRIVRLSETGMGKSVTANLPESWRNWAEAGGRGFNSRLEARQILVNGAWRWDVAYGVKGDSTLVAQFNSEGLLSGNRTKYLNTVFDFGGRTLISSKPSIMTLEMRNAFENAYLNSIDGFDEAVGSGSATFALDMFQATSDLIMPGHFSDNDITLMKAGYFFNSAAASGNLSEPEMNLVISAINDDRQGVPGHIPLNLQQLLTYGDFNRVADLINNNNNA